MDIDLKQFQQVFIEECLEGLEVMESELLKLTPGNFDSEVINTIFRVAHSIKGGAGTFGFNQLTEFTHVAETLLDDLRSEKIKLNDEHINLLLQTKDCLIVWIQLLAENSQSTPDMADSLKLQYNQFLQLDPKLETVAIEGDVLIKGNPSAINQYDDTWLIHFVPGQDILKQGNEPRLIFAELAEMGALKVTPQFKNIPAWKNVAPEDIYVSWELELVSSVSEAQIKEAFEWVEDDSTITINRFTASDESADNKIVMVSEQLSESPASTAVVKSIAVPKSAETNSIRVSIDKVDALINMVGELVITQAMLGELGQNFSAEKLPALKKGLDQLSQHTREMQSSVMKIRMLPIQFAFNRIPRMVRDLSEQLGKNVLLRIHGEETELDKIMLEKLSDPLVHLVRNALDHGIETIAERKLAGKSEVAYLDISAFHQGGEIIVEIRDDGRGLNRPKIHAKAIEKGIVNKDLTYTDHQIDELIFAPGFSTVEAVSDVSGRGVGMDVVKRNIESLGGGIKIESTTGVGSCFSIRLPLTLSIMDGQLVKIGSKTYILPIMSIIESLQLKIGMVTKLADDTEVFKLRDEFIPIIRLYQVLNHDSGLEHITDGLLVVVESGNNKYGLLVDDLAAQQQVVIKNLEDNFMKVSCVSGATILGNGTVALILDIADIVKRVTDERYLQQSLHRGQRTHVAA
ncbi:chemotaxis protein CheA [Moritella marina ATCC 15381]|uniref:Chemotaxis protein CheA n=1 Tax=Moritella marina ATCC 15381 TaxID=1202962 RepID=A0A5J6WMN9_MORMI|nr:chemotaxis protein CheA [Moritella marina]QFI39389.1 chemotaxis protein CheA [Moritella marina ATCC 15381]